MQIYVDERLSKEPENFPLMSLPRDLQQQARLLKRLGFGFLTEPYNAPVEQRTSRPSAAPSSRAPQRQPAPAPPRRLKPRLDERAKALEQDASWKSATPEMTPEEREEALESLAREANACQACRLFMGRRQALIGTGNPMAELMFVSEAPSPAEDAAGEFYRGEGGELFASIIKAMTFTPGEVYLASAIRCAPAGDRPPESDEIEACRDFLRRQIEIIRPKVLVALGPSALLSLLPHRSAEGIQALRGEWLHYRSIPLMPTLPPASIARSKPRKKLVWEDMQKVMLHLGRKPAKG